MWSKVKLENEKVVFPSRNNQFTNISVDTSNLKCRVCGSLLPHNILEVYVWTTKDHHKAHKAMFGTQKPLIQIVQFRCREHYENMWQDC